MEQMIHLPRFKSCYSPAVMDESTVIVLSEVSRQVLRGPIFGALIPLLDGSRSADDLADQLADRFSPAEVYFHLLQLEREGWLEEAAVPIADCGLTGLQTIGHRPSAIGHREAEPLSAEAERRREAFWTLLGGSAEPPAEKTGLNLTAVGEAATDGVEQALASSGDFAVNQRDWRSESPEDGSLWIVVAPDYLEPELAEFNRRALEADWRWVLFQPWGVQPWLGPLFVPGETGCWECLAQRLRGHRRVEGVSVGESETSPLRLAVGALDLSLTIAASLLTLEVEKWRAGCPDLSLPGQVLSLDFKTLELRRHRLRRRPQCPACGQAEPTLSPTFVPPAPLTLQSRRKSAHDDNGHRICLAAETLQALDGLISPITGAVGRLQRVTSVPDFFGFYFRTSYPAPAVPREFTRVGMRWRAGISSGKGRTEAQAQVSAIGEALERYCVRFQGYEPRVRARFDDIREVAIPPHALLGYSENQYRDRAAWRRRGYTAYVADPYEDHIAIDWTPAWSLTEGRWKLAPSCFVYVGYPPEGGRVYARGDPNGIAAGNCLEEALLQALLELVERDAVALWWYNRVPRPALDLASFEDPYVHRCLAGLEAAGRSLHVLDLTHDLDIPVFAAVTLPPPGSAEEAWFGYGAHLDARIALGRALSELGQSWGLQSDYLAPEYALRVQSRSLPETDFIRPLPEAPRRPFSAFPNRSSQDFLGDLHFCVDRLQRAGLETLVVDLTCPDVGVPVVRALVPGLLHCCPRFAPGRLYDVPVALGWLERRRAEDELNPIPFNF